MTYLHLIYKTYMYKITQISFVIFCVLSLQPYTTDFVMLWMQCHNLFVFVSEKTG